MRAVRLYVYVGVAGHARFKGTGRFDKNRAKSRKNKKGVSGCRAAVTFIYTRARIVRHTVTFGRLKPICGIVFRVRPRNEHSRRALEQERRDPINRTYKDPRRRLRSN